MVFYETFAIISKDIFQTMQIPTRLIPARVTAKQSKGKVRLIPGREFPLIYTRQGKCPSVQMQNHLKRGVAIEG